MNWKKIRVVPIDNAGNRVWGWQVIDAENIENDLIQPPMQNFEDAYVFAEDFAIRWNLEVLPALV